MLLGVERILVICLFCLSWKTSEGFFFLGNNKDQQELSGKADTGNYINRLRILLGGMQKIMNIAIKSPSSPKSETTKVSVCPNVQCTKIIPQNCRMPLHYEIHGQRCDGCDIDICKIRKIKETKRKLVLNRNTVNNRINQARNWRQGLRHPESGSQHGIESSVSIFRNRLQNPDLNFESRWLLPSREGINDNTGVDFPNSINKIDFQDDSISRIGTRDIDLSQFPPGAENSWVTSPLFR